MTYTNEKLFNALAAFNQAIARVHFKSVKTMLHVKKKRSEMAELLEPYDEVKNDMVRKYGNGDELDTGKLAPEPLAQFSRQWNELNNAAVDFDFGQKIKLSELKEANALPSAIELEILENFIEVDIEE